MTDGVAYEFDDKVSMIRLERPKRYNAMTLEMWRAVEEGIRRADDGPRAVVLTAEGELFCSGDDIQSLADIENERDARILAVASTPSSSRRSPSSGGPTVRPTAGSNS